MNPELTHQPPGTAEAEPKARPRGVAVAQREVDVRDAGPLVDALAPLGDDDHRRATSEPLRSRIHAAVRQAGFLSVTVDPRGLQSGAFTLQLILNGILQRDYPVVQAGVLFVAASFVLVNLAVDLSYALFDPRIRY